MPWVAVTVMPADGIDVAAAVGRGDLQRPPRPAAPRAPTPRPARCAGPRPGPASADAAAAGRAASRPMAAAAAMLAYLARLLPRTVILPGLVEVRPECAPGTHITCCLPGAGAGAAPGRSAGRRSAATAQHGQREHGRQHEITYSGHAPDPVRERPVADQRHPRVQDGLLPDAAVRDQPRRRAR